MFIYHGVRHAARVRGAFGLAASSFKSTTQSSYIKSTFQSLPKGAASSLCISSYRNSTFLIKSPALSLGRSFKTSSNHSQQLLHANSNPARAQAKKAGFRFIHILLISLFSAGAGAYAVMTTITNTLLPKLSYAESATAFKAEHEHQVEVEEYINNHPLVKSLRSNPAYSESRPHLRFSDAHRATSLTAGTLSGPGKIVVPPIVFLDEEAKSMVLVCYLGDLVCGYPGFVHGGLLATLLDEGLGRCTFTALPNKVGMTANLNINYRAPTKAGQYIVMKAQVTKAEGRKAWAEGRIETLPKTEDEQPIVLVDGSALFVEPRQVKLLSLVTGPIAA